MFHKEILHLPARKYGGQTGQAVKPFQITPYVNDFQTLNSPGSWQSV